MRTRELKAIVNKTNDKIAGVEFAIKVLRDFIDIYKNKVKNAEKQIQERETSKAPAKTSKKVSKKKDKKNA